MKNQKKNESDLSTHICIYIYVFSYIHVCCINFPLFDMYLIYEWGVLILCVKSFSVYLYKFIIYK